MTNPASQALAGPVLVPAAPGMMTRALRVLVPAGLVLVLAALGIQVPAATVARVPAALLVLGTNTNSSIKGHSVAFVRLKYGLYELLV